MPNNFLCSMNVFHLCCIGIRGVTRIFTVHIKIKPTLLGRDFFVFLSLARQKNETSASSYLPFLSIRHHLSKSLDGKISRSFGIYRWCEFAHAQQKNKHNLADVSFFLLIRERNLMKPLPSTVRNVLLASQK